MNDVDDQPLLRPVRLGGLDLRNRIVMAPLTRMRSHNEGLVPTALHAEYYAQRASAGLIISEGVFVGATSLGWADVPGLWSDAQVEGWRLVTDAVHEKGGHMFAQLWHAGAMSHPDFYNGLPPPSASDVNPDQESVTPTGRKPTVKPRSMTREEIRSTTSDFKEAARNAISAGFDGVQIQAGYLYLFNQFLSVRTNVRSDEYGGTVENRARFLFEVLDEVVDAVGGERVGVKAGPATTETGAFISTEETLGTSEYVLERLNSYDLSHLLLMGQMSDYTGTPLAKVAGDEMFRHFRQIYCGSIIANVGITPDRGNRLIADGLVDLVAFGRLFISNPDLPERLAGNTMLAQADVITYYGKTAEGYTDYPALQLSNA